MEDIAPNLAPNATMPTAAAPEAAVAAAPPKKSRKGLIAALVCLLVLVAAGITAIILLANNNDPEHVVLDAVTKTLKSPTHTASGKIEIATKTDSTVADSSLASGRVIIELDGKNNGLGSSASVTVTVKIAGNSDFIFRFGEVFQDDGTLYLKTSDLADFVDSAVYFIDYQLKDNGVTSSPLENAMDNIKAVARKADNTWWRISLSEIIKAIGVNDERVTDRYDCVVGAAKNFFGEASLGRLADTYKNNRFIAAARADHKPSSFSSDAYADTIDATKLAEFWNKVIASDDVTKIRNCLPEGQTPDVLSAVSSDNLSTLANKTVYLDIDSGHNLNGLYASISGGNFNYLADLRLSTGAVTVEAPSDARPITELMSDIMTVIQSFVGLSAAIN